MSMQRQSIYTNIWTYTHSKKLPQELFLYCFKRANKKVCLIKRIMSDQIKGNHNFLSFSANAYTIHLQIIAKILFVEWASQLTIKLWAQELQRNYLDITIMLKRLFVLKRLFKELGKAGFSKLRSGNRYTSENEYCNRYEIVRR